MAAVPIAVAVLDRDLRYVHVNPALAALNGVPLEQHIGRKVRDVIPDAAAWLEPLLVQVIATGEPVLDVERSAPDERNPGRCRYWSASFVPLRHGGDIVGVGGLIVDTTRAREAEAERERLEEQIRAIQKLESLGRLTGGIAHDFNNLLTAMLGYAELLLEQRSLDESARSDIEEIRKAATSAAGLTRQLLAFSRRQMLEPKTLSLNTVVANVEAILRRVLGEDITLTTVLSPSLANVQADPAQIEQVLMNLAVNARDAMPSGGQLTIETGNAVLSEAFVAEHRGASAGPHVRLVVRDTGVGMSEAVKSRMFEPFFTTKEKGKGTGLGLATVYGVIKQMGGSIWVDTAVGAGATFTLYLPAVGGAAMPAERPAPARSGPLQGRETVMLVEDQPEVRRVAAAVLKQSGYRVIEASGANEALQAASDGRRFDLLLTDVVMPGMGGRDLARTLTSAVPRLRVIYMSGYTDHAIVHQGVLDPGLAFVQKPFTPQGLLEKIRIVLDAPEPPPV